MVNMSRAITGKWVLLLRCEQKGVAHWSDSITQVWWWCTTMHSVLFSVTSHEYNTTWHTCDKLTKASSKRKQPDRLLIQRDITQVDKNSQKSQCGRSYTWGPEYKSYIQKHSVHIEHTWHWLLWVSVAKDHSLEAWPMPPKQAHRCIKAVLPKANKGLIAIAQRGNVCCTDTVVTQVQPLQLRPSTLD